jgi:putative membrane protein
MVTMIETIVAEAGWHGGPWFLVFPLLWIALFIGVWLVVRNRDVHAIRRSAETVLGERYARGEIDEQEYRERLAVLRQRNAR